MEKIQMTNLPANIANMATGLAASVSAVSEGTGGEAYMKMDRQGVFMYGAEGTIVEEGSIWAVNPGGFQHGFTAWGSKSRGNAGKNVGEVLVSASSPMPLESNMAEVNGDWSKAIALTIKCTDGEDAGTQCLFKSNSLGGRKAYAALLQKMVARIQAGESDIVPLVEMESDSYEHPSYGKIFNPIFKVVGWAAMDDAAPAAAPEAEPEPEKAEEPAAEEKPARRQRRKKAS